MQLTNESRHRITTADPNELPPKPVEVDSSWRARMLLYATIEPCPKTKPKSQRLPKILSKTQLEDVAALRGVRVGVQRALLEGARQ